MWDLEQFCTWLGAGDSPSPTGARVWTEVVLPQMRNIATWAVRTRDFLGTVSPLLWKMSTVVRRARVEEEEVEEEREEKGEGEWWRGGGVSWWRT